MSFLEEDWPFPDFPDTFVSMMCEAVGGLVQIACHRSSLYSAVQLFIESFLPIRLFP